MINWPNQLVEDLARRRAVLFLGAGVSRNSLSANRLKRPPEWSEFLRTALRSCDDLTPENWATC